MWNLNLSLRRHPQNSVTAASQELVEWPSFFEYLNNNQTIQNWQAIWSSCLFTPSHAEGFTLSMFAGRVFRWQLSVSVILAQAGIQNHYELSPPDG